MRLNTIHDWNGTKILYRPGPLFYSGLFGWNISAVWKNLNVLLVAVQSTCHIKIVGSWTKISHCRLNYNDGFSLKLLKSWVLSIKRSIKIWLWLSQILKVCNNSNLVSTPWMPHVTQNFMDMFCKIRIFTNE